MPKPTRDQQFQKCFNSFFEHINENFYPELKEYTLESNTMMKNRFDHNYTLTFPRKVVAYHVDVFTVDENGVVIPPGPVMQTQEIPKIRNFKSHFHDYFKDYILRNNAHILSYTDIRDYWYENGTDRITADELSTGVLPSTLLHFDLKFRIDVVYHKSHIPFPVPISTKEQFEQKCKRLEIRNAELVGNIQAITAMYQEKEEQYDALRRKIRIERRNTEQKYQVLFEKMQKKFRELYKQCDSTDDCPVCYETIDSEKLKVPGCCHTICTDCAGRCNNCPICRESY
jgi:hypothetical protein